MEGKPQDAAFLSDPKKPDAVKAGAKLFPGNTGSRWTFLTSSSQRTLLGARDEVAVTGPRRVGNASGQVWEWTRNGQIFSQSVYEVTNKGVRQLAIGRRAEVVIEPPLTVLRYPVVEGDRYPWEGTLRGGNQRQPARVSVRVTRFEPVKTRAGTFKAFRVDTMLTLIQPGKNVHIPSVSWYAPGVGLIRQETVDIVKGAQTETTIRELSSYRLR